MLATQQRVNGSEPELFSVETPGGQIHIRWDYEASATANAQMAFFAEFVATTGVYESWVSSCPLTYSSGNAFHKPDHCRPKQRERCWTDVDLRGHSSTSRSDREPGCAVTSYALIALLSKKTSVSVQHFE